MLILGSPNGSLALEYIHSCKYVATGLGYEEMGKCIRAFEYKSLEGLNFRHIYWKWPGVKRLKVTQT